MTPASGKAECDSMAAELLPCPFCGAKHVRPHEKCAGNHTSADKHYSIRCGVCTFNGPRGLTAEQAVEAWNRRAHLATAAANGPGEAVVLPFAILADEMMWLRRFKEQCDDGDGYDVPKPMMIKLAEIGLVRHLSAARYEITNFGLSVLNGDFSTPQPGMVTVPRKMPQEFCEWLESQMPPRTIISNPTWWAPKIYRAAIDAALRSGGREET